MKTMLISQVNRATARNTVRELKQAGKVAKVVDKGSNFSGSDRWAVETQRNTLTSPRKPSGNDPVMVCHGAKSSAKQAVKRRAFVSVRVKKSRI